MQREFAHTMCATSSYWLLRLHPIIFEIQISLLQHFSLSTTEERRTRQKQEIRLFSTFLMIPLLLSIHKHSHFMSCCWNFSHFFFFLFYSIIFRAESERKREASRRWVWAACLFVYFARGGFPFFCCFFFSFRQVFLAGLTIEHIAAVESRALHREAWGLSVRESRASLTTMMKMSEKEKSTTRKKQREKN